MRGFFSFCRASPPGYTSVNSKSFPAQQVSATNPQCATQELHAALGEVRRLYNANQWLTQVGGPASLEAARAIKRVQGALILLGALESTDVFRMDLLPTLEFALCQANPAIPFTPRNKTIAALYKRL